MICMICMYVCMYVCVYVCMYVCMYVAMGICGYVYVHVYVVCACMCMCMRIYVYTDILHACMHACMHSKLKLQPQTLNPKQYYTIAWPIRSKLWGVMPCLALLNQQLTHLDIGPEGWTCLHGLGLGWIEG